MRPGPPRPLEALAALLLCAAAACLLTWPLVTDLAGSTLAGRFQMSHAWAMETVNDGLRGTSPHVRMWIDPPPEVTGGVPVQGLVVHTTAINFPGGGEIVFIAWFNLLLGSLLRGVLPYLAAFNTAVLVVLALAPWSAWLLARRLGASRGAAALAGLIYGWSPYALGVLHNGQLAKYNHAWLALLALATWELAGPSRRAWLWVPLAASSALAALGSAPDVFLYGVLGCALLVAWRLPALPDWPGRAAATLRLLVAAALAALPALPLVRHFAGRERSMLSPSTPGEDTAARELAARLDCLLLPRSCPVPAGQPQTEEVHVAYLGLVALGLALVGLARDRRRAGPWASLVLAFAVLAMGRSAVLGGLELPLPLAAVVAAFPEGRGLVFVYRAAVIATLGLAVLAAFGADALAARWPRWHRQGLALLGAAILVDHLAVAPAPWPLAWTRVDLPPAWGTLVEEPGAFGVLAWPVDHAGLDGLPAPDLVRIQALTQRLILYEGWHDKGLPFVDKGNQTRDAYDTGLSRGLVRLTRGETPDARLSIPWSVQWLARQDIRYVIVHPEALPAGRAEAVEAWLTEHLGPPRRWPDSPALRWTLPAAAPEHR